MSIKSTNPKNIMNRIIFSHFLIVYKYLILNVFVILQNFIHKLNEKHYTESSSNFRQIYPLQKQDFMKHRDTKKNT